MSLNGINIWALPIRIEEMISNLEIKRYSPGHIILVDAYKQFLESRRVDES